MRIEEGSKEKLGGVDIAHTMLLAGCRTLECLVASHRSHRRLLLDAGVGEDLVCVLNCCADKLDENVRVSAESTYAYGIDNGLVNHICLAIGSLAKDSTPKNESQLSLGVPVLCRVLSMCSASPHLFKQKGDLRVNPEEEKIESMEGAEGSGGVCITVSESTCRALGYIASAQNNRDQSVRAKARATRRLSMQGVARNIGVEECIINSLQQNASSRSATMQACFAVSELALNSDYSADRMSTLGVRNLLISVLNIHIPQVRRIEPNGEWVVTRTSSDHEDDVFCMVWCRALYALLRVLGGTFFTTDETDHNATMSPRAISADSLIILEKAEEGSIRNRVSPSQSLITMESLSTILLGLTTVNGVSVSPAIAASACMALSALVSIPSLAPSLKGKILDYVVGTILEKHVSHADWFSFSLPSLRLRSISASPLPSIKNTSAATTTAATGGMVYWFSIFLYQLFSSQGGAESTFTSHQLQLELVTKCLHHNVCDLLVRALGRFNQDECVSAASYMALSVMMSIGVGIVRIDIEEEEQRVIDDGEGGTEGGQYEEEEGREEPKIRGLDMVCQDSSTGVVAFPYASSYSSSMSDLATEEVDLRTKGEIASTVSTMRRKVISLGLCPMLLETLRNYPSSRQVADWCLKCLPLLLSYSQNTVHKLCAANACETLPVCMQAHQTSIQASIAGCEAIYLIIHSINLASTSLLYQPTHHLSSSYAKILGGAGGCEAVLSVFHRHKDNAMAIESASKAIAALAAVSEGNLSWLGPLGSCLYVSIQHVLTCFSVLKHR